MQGLLTARAGYKYKDGEITKIPAIVAVVERKIHKASLTTGQLLPSSFEGTPVEVVSADATDLLFHKYATKSPELSEVTKKLELTYLESLMLKSKSSATEAELLEAAPANNYRAPDDVRLVEIKEPMTLLCHVSPEGGWKSLGPFLADVNEHLQVAMYDFSAPHIVNSLKNVLRSGASLKMVYDGNPAAGVGQGKKEDDVTEESSVNSFRKIGKRNFESITAWKGKEGICSNAYHIKVAVKDHQSFWLSSGNWQTSNQPNEDFESDTGALPQYNREWNIIISNKTLSDVYERFIEWDFQCSSQKPEAAVVEAELPVLFLEEEGAEIGRYSIFPPRKFVFTKSNPLRIQPILSPDNYIEHALQIIQSATKTLYFINQYITYNGEQLTDEYKELLDALKEKNSSNTIDCKIILRSQMSSNDRKIQESLQAYGFDVTRNKLRWMKNTHTKGIIADGERIILGSHNWSGSGVQFNRDASLCIYDEGVAQYYQDTFLHDWEKRTIKSRREETILFPGEEVNESMMQSETLTKLNWKDYLS